MTVEILMEKGNKMVIYIFMELYLWYTLKIKVICKENYRF